MLLGTGVLVASASNALASASDPLRLLLLLCFWFGSVAAALRKHVKKVVRPVFYSESGPVPFEANSH